MMAALLLVARLALGGLLVVAGALKLGDPSAFASEITNYQIIPSLAPYLAATLPATEILTGAGLVALPRSWRRAAALAAGGLCAMFLGATTLAYLRGINVDCGCFGAGSGPITVLTLLRNLALLGVALLIGLGAHRK